MKNVTVVVATYDSQPVGETDFETLEAVGKENRHQLHDAALISKSATGEAEVIERKSQHGWGKGAIAGAVLGVVTGSIVATAVAGAATGGGISALTRDLGKKKVEELAETLGKGQIVLVAVVDTDAVDTFTKALTGATKVSNESTGLTSDDLAEAMPGSAT